MKLAPSSISPARPSPPARLARGAAVLVSIVFLAAAAPPALAFPPSPREVHERMRHDLKRFFDLPRQIHEAHRAAFGALFGGRMFYGPHHHYHAIYRFPVFVGGRVITRPYTYCNDSLFIGAGEPLPPLAIDVHVAPPGLIYGVRPSVHYASPGPCGRDGYGYEHERHGHGRGHGYGHQHDDEDD